MVARFWKEAGESELVLLLRACIAILRWLVLAVSCLGYILYLTKHMRCELAVGFLFSCIGSLLFVGGILNLLKELTVAICAGGLYLCIRERRQLRRETLLRPGMVFFAAAAVFFLFLLRGQVLTNYDNFSHWGRAVKVLLKRNALPTFLDEGIYCTAYPTGSAGFIYYVVKILGNQAEWVWLWAQAVLMAGMCAGLFAFGEGKVKNALIFAGTLILLCGNVGFTQLYVDSLLSLTAVGAMAFAYYYRESIGEKLPLLLPYLVFLIAIKNSGALFAVLVLLYVFLLLRPEGNAQLLKRWALVCLAAGATLLLWKRHVSMVFVYGQSSKHAMSLSNFKSILQGKTGAELLGTVVSFGKKMLLGGWENWLLALVSAALWLPGIRKEKNRPAARLAAFALLSYGVYMVGMLGMYLFSMPSGEAARLASYDRYHKTVLMFSWGLLLMSFATWQQVSAPGRKALRNVLGGGIAVLVLATFSLNPKFSNYRPQEQSGTERVRLEQLLDENQVPRGKTYLFLVSDQREDSGLLFYLAGYLLDTQDFAIRTPTTAEEADPELYEYVIAWEDTPECRAYWQEHFPEDSWPVAENAWEQVLPQRIATGFYYEE